MKRAMDLSLSIFFLMLSFPVFIMVSLLVKLSSPGPVFFRQWRAGKDGKLFMLYKFRTMRVDCACYAESPKHNRDDPRVTGAGFYLRKTGLDELPQLINVIKGDMSLVGPRPEMPYIVDQYTPEQRFRLDVLPGLTGLWQLSSDRSLPIHQNLEYDRHYIENPSIAQDIRIIARTVCLTFVNVVTTLPCLFWKEKCPGAGFCNHASKKDVAGNRG